LSDAPAGDKRRLNGGTEKTRSKMRMAEERRQPPRKGRSAKNRHTFRSFLNPFLSFFFFLSRVPRSGLRSYQPEL
jgi:hypothetical protein